MCVCVRFRIREEKSYIKYLFFAGIELSSLCGHDDKDEETEEDADRGSEGEKKREWLSERRDMI